MTRLVLQSVVSAFVFSLATAALASAPYPGDPDPAWGSSGVVKLQRGRSDHNPTPPVVQGDGKVVSALEVAFGVRGFGALVRFNTDGTPDTSFGTQGVAGADLMLRGVTGHGGYLYAVGVFTSGGFDAGLNQPYDDVRVLRFNSNGSPDTTNWPPGGVSQTFYAGSGGLQNGTQSAEPIGVDSAGRIVIAGYTTVTGLHRRAFVVRFNADGSLDTSFGTGGKFVFAPVSATGTYETTGMVINADDSIVVSGAYGTSSFDTGWVAKVTSAGALDATFGTGGVYVAASQSDCLGLIPDGTSYLVGCTAGGDLHVFRLTALGALDATFDVTVNAGGADDVLANLLRLPDSRIIASGIGGSGVFSLVALTSAGALDATFGTGGVYNAPESEFSYARGAVWNGSEIQVVGKRTWTASPGDLISATVSSSGTRTSVAFTTPTYSLMYAKPRALADGSVVVAGSVNENITLDENRLDAIVSRLDASGSFDGTYGTSGHSQVNIGGIFPGGVRDLVVMGDGRSLITADFGDGGNGQTRAGAARLNAGGGLDTTGFNAAGSNPGPGYNWVNANVLPAGAATFSRNLAVQSDGKVVVATRGAQVGQPQHAVVTRFNADGSLDTLYGSGGFARAIFVTPGSSPGRSLTLDAAGRAVIVAENIATNQIRIARFTTSGALDATFGTGGKAGHAIPAGSTLQLPTRVVETADNKLLVTWTSFNGPQRFGGVMRLNADGTLDTSFGTNGAYVHTLNVGPGGNIWDVAILPNGRILMLANGNNTDPGSTSLLIRLNPNGQLDASFGSGTGTREYTEGTSEGSLLLTGLDVFANGAVVMAGTGFRFELGTATVIKTIADTGATTPVANVALGSSANPSVYWQLITLTATISGGAGTPTGTVTFADGATPIAGCVNMPVDVYNQANCNTSSLTIGSHNITAVYSGDAGRLASMSSVLVQVVNKVPSSVALGSSPNPSTTGQSVTITATVTGGAVMGGTVAFKDGGVDITGCISQPLVAYTATCTTSALPNGARTLTGVYSGDTNYAGSTSPGYSHTVNAPVTSVARSDFNQDGKSDVIWRDTSGGLVYQWQMNGLAISGQGYMPSVPAAWSIGGLGDATGDGKVDVLWRNASTGQVYLWALNGLSITSQGYLPSVAAPWVVAGMGDMSGDGKADVLWRNPTTGQNYIWILNGLSVTSQGYLPSVSGSDWEVMGVADYSGDGKADVVWRNKSTGQNYMWIMNGLTITSQAFLPTVTPAADWEIVGSPDADGNGRADVLWRHKTTGQNYLWQMNGLAITSQGYLPSVSDNNWKVVGYGDYNGDGRGDVLWRHGTTGQNYLWTLNGFTVASQGYLPSVSGSNWVPVK